MYQKDLVRSAWQAAGLYDDKDAKLQQFLKLLDDPTQCWLELTDQCRRSYTAYKARIVQPILASSDTLAHLMVIRASAATREDEMTLLEQYIAASDPVRDHVELKAAALKNVPRLNEALLKKRHLPRSVRSVITAPTTPAAAPIVATEAPEGVTPAVKSDP
jgi:hypothetical protein